MKKGDKATSERFTRLILLIWCAAAADLYSQEPPLAQAPSKQPSNADRTVIPDYLVKLALAPDGRTFAAGSLTEHTNDGAVYAGDIDSRQLYWSATCHRVFALAFSPDATLLATSHAGVYRNYGEVRIRNARTGSVLFSLLGHRGSAQSLRFSTDGRLLATSGREVVEERRSRGQIFVWDTQTGEARTRITVKRGPVGPVAFGQENTMLVAAVGGWRTNSKIFLWSTQTGRLVKELKPSFGPIMAIDVSPSGRLLAVASAEEETWVESGVWRKGRITVLNIDSGETRWIYRDLAGPVNCVSFSADGQLLAATSFTVEIGVTDSGSTARSDQREWLILSAEDGRLINRRSGTFPVAAMAFSPDGRRVITTGSDNRILVWTADGMLTKTLGKKGWLERKEDPTVVDARRIVTLTFSPDGSYLASADDRGTIKAWDVRSGSPVASIDRQGGSGRPAVFSSDSSHLVFAGNSDPNRLGVLTLRSRKLQWLDAPPALISCLAAGPGTILIGAQDGEVTIWDSREWKSTGRRRFSSEIRYLGALPGSALIAVGCQDGSVTFADQTSLEPGQVARLPGVQPVQAIAFAPQLKQLAVAGQGKEIHLLDIVTMRRLRTIGNLDEPVESLAFSSDGKQLAAIQANGRLACWNTSGGKAMWQIRQEFGGSSIAFAPNGRTLAAGWGNNTITLHDPVDGGLLTVLK